MWLETAQTMVCKCVHSVGDSLSFHSMLYQGLQARKIQQNGLSTYKFTLAVPVYPRALVEIYNEINTTSILQPMDKWIISISKSYF